MTRGLASAPLSTRPTSPGSLPARSRALIGTVENRTSPVDPERSYDRYRDHAALESPRLVVVGRHIGPRTADTGAIIRQTLLDLAEEWLPD
jgi:hypothetical protein